MADIDSEKERRLVADLLEGDESAFCELYALYKDRLMWFSLKFLNPGIWRKMFFRMLSPLFGRIAVS